MAKNICKNEKLLLPPLVLALVVGFVIIVLATLFPPIKQTIVEIAKALRGM